MNDWNPNNEAVLYFHFCGGSGKKRNSYLKVDTVKQRVWALHLEPPGDKRGRAYCPGIYELKWVTFTCNYMHYLKYDYRKLKGVYGPEHTTKWQYPPAERLMLKRTTKNQFTLAVNSYIKSIT